MVPVVGVTLSEPRPVGFLHIPLSSGANVLYGLNGVGKTRTLRAIERLLGARFGDRSRPHSRRRPSFAFYSAGGIHLRVTGNDIDLTQRSAFFIAQAVFDPGELEMHLLVPEERLEPLDIRTRLIDRALENAPWPNPQRSEAEALIDQGRWFVSPCRDGVEIYVASHPAGPLDAIWTRADDEYRDRLAAMDDPPFGSYEDETQQAITWEEKVSPAEAGLLPRPALLGMPEPDWLAFPVSFIGVAAPLVTDEPFSDVPLTRIITERQIDLTDATTRALGAIVRSRTPLELGVRPPRLIADGVQSSDLLDAAAELEERANAQLGALFDEPPTVDLDISRPERWFQGERLKWLVTVDGRRFELSGLGAAHERYVGMALARAVESRGGSWLGLAVALIDEPERALHRRAERRLARGLATLGDLVVCATHSPSLFIQSAQLLHVTRAGDGSVEVGGFNWMHGDLMTLAERIGVSAGDLLTHLRVMVFVEGEHDRLMIDALCADAFEAGTAMVFALGGTNGLQALPEARLLFEVSEATILVVVDNVDRAAVQTLRADLDRAPSTRVRHAKLQAAKLGTPEERKLKELFAAAIERDRLDRIQTWGFRKRDIVEYLPVESIAPWAPSWDALKAQFLRETNRQRFSPGDGRPFKDWVNSKTGGRYSVPGVNAALSDLLGKRRAAPMTGLPPGFSEFADLSAAIRQLSADS